MFVSLTNNQNRLERLYLKICWHVFLIWARYVENSSSFIDHFDIWKKTDQVGVGHAYEDFHTIATYYKTKSPATSVCLFAINSKSTEQICILFATTVCQYCLFLVYNKFRILVTKIPVLFQFRRFVSDRCSAEAMRLSYGTRTVICFHTNRMVWQQCGVDNENARRQV